MNPSVGAPIILFVDDEPLSRKYFQRAFGREMNVVTADSCQRAQNLLARDGDRVAVLITDQRMPAGDGVSLLSEVKVGYPHIVRLLTTSHADIEEAIAAVNDGEIWRYITKPWDLEALRALLDSAMEFYRARSYEQALLSERRRGMLMVASHIDHEMRTPLRSIHAAARGVEVHLPRLLEGHAWAVRAGADIKPLSQRHRRTLEDAMTRIQRVVDRANTVIDLLLANAGAYQIDPELFAPCGIKNCVTAALEDFPFTRRERALVSWHGGSDFTFNGSLNLMVLVLHNLLRNALRAVATAGRGNVCLWTGVDTASQELHIKDTGIGIGHDLLPKIFDDFASFTNAHHSAGLGLGFCRKVITSFGGRIDCHSEENRYTQFDLWLPPPPNFRGKTR